MSFDVRLGSELAGSRIDSVNRRGGMGVVYLAEHLRLKRKVALKVLAAELAADQLFRDRFIHESELAASLDHPNIIDIYDAGEADGLLYLAMRHVAGRDLKTLIGQDGPLDPARAVALLTQVASALDAAHERGLVHRDVKPANVLVQPPTSSLGEHAYLTDFGLTKRPESMSGLTKTGQFLGSVEYAAPEQFEGKPLTPQTDVYSLGCVLYECLTAEIPFPREHEAAVMHAHLKAPPPRPSAKRLDLSSGIDAVGAKAMAKRSTDRYPTCGALAEAARSALTPEAAVTPGPGPIPARRWTWIRAAAAALILVAGVLAAVFLTGRGEGSRETPPTTHPSTGLLLQGRGVARIDVQTGVLEETLPVANAHAVAADDSFAWVGGNDELTKVSVTSNATVASITPLFPRGRQVANPTAARVDVALGRGGVWVTDNRASIDPRAFTGRVLQIDPTANRRTWTAAIPDATAVVFAAGSIWVTDPADGLIYRLDPSDGSIIATIPAESGSTPFCLASSSAGLWVAGGASGLASLIDPATNKVARTIPLEYAAGVAADDDWLWVTSGPGGEVSQYTANGDHLMRRIDLGGHADAITVGGDSIWVADNPGRIVWKIDRRSGEVQKRINLSGTPYDLAIAGGALWVTLFSQNPA
jgi:tRNA A-37 threonylcarbamoyl transferase component Bud32